LLFVYIPIHNEITNKDFHYITVNDKLLISASVHPQFNCTSSLFPSLATMAQKYTKYNNSVTRTAANE